MTVNKLNGSYKDNVPNYYKIMLIVMSPMCY